MTRRNDINRYIEAEHKIRHAILAVEAMPADHRLTNAVVLLQKAQNWVADYVDHIEALKIKDPGPSSDGR
jgi:hypothetical protein